MAGRLPADAPLAGGRRVRSHRTRLRTLLRIAQGRAPQPTAAILDSRTLQSTPESGARAGYDGAKRKKGSKIHAAVDTLGHLLALHATPANAQDRTQVARLAAAVQEATGQSVQVAFVDQGYTGAQPAQDAATYGLRLEVVTLPDVKRGFVLLPRRWVTVTVRWVPVTLRPPDARRHALPPVLVWAIWVHEDDPPAQTEALDWVLLTTVPVTATAEALERIDWYTCRWVIEVWHKVLKSGCLIERRQLASAANLQRGLALFSVIAWRLLYATLLARVVPAMPCTVLLEASEWQALCCAIHQTPQPPAQPPSLGQAVRWLAHLGGYMGRTHDDPPGAEVLWRGLHRLVDLTLMYHIFTRAPTRARCG